MMRYAVAGTPSDVGRYLDDFAAEARADEPDRRLPVARRRRPAALGRPHRGDRRRRRCLTRAPDVGC
nr:hypothetical protein [Angustibacter aerolatus]